MPVEVDYGDYSALEDEQCKDDPLRYKYATFSRKVMKLSQRDTHCTMVL